MFRDIKLRTFLFYNYNLPTKIILFYALANLFD